MDKIRQHTNAEKDGRGHTSDTDNNTTGTSTDTDTSIGGDHSDIARPKNDG